MDWKEFLINAYSTSNDDGFTCKPILNFPASEEDIKQTEIVLGMEIPLMLKELLLQTNGFGEELISEGGGRKGPNLDSPLLTTGEIIEFTEYYRDSRLNTNIDFNEMMFFGNTHVDGIYFATRKNENSVYAWYPSELEFRWLSTDLKEFINSWLSGNLSV